MKEPNDELTGKLIIYINEQSIIKSHLFDGVYKLDDILRDYASKLFINEHDLISKGTITVTFTQNTESEVFDV